MNALPHWFLACAIVALASPGCTLLELDKPREQASIPAVTSNFGPDYVIQPEDVLEVTVWKEPDLKKEVLVRPDGGISYPLAGNLQAAGKTVAQLEKELTKKVAEYMPEPGLSVAVLKASGNKVYVIGRVAKPGEYITGRYMSVMQALSLSGGLTPYAGEHGIKVLRKENGKDLVFPFDYAAVKRGRHLEQNIPLKGGDVVVVP